MPNCNMRFGPGFGQGQSQVSIFSVTEMCGLHHLHKFGEASTEGSSYLNRFTSSTMEGMISPAEPEMR